MDFEGRTILRLADDTDRATLFSPTVGQRLFGAAFIASNAEVGPVTGVSIRSFDLVPAVSEQQHLSVALDSRDGSMNWSGSGSIYNPAPHSQVNAVTELLVTTELRQARSTVVQVANEPLDDLGDLDQVDAFIVAADGVLPVDDEALAGRRFSALKQMTKDRFPESRSDTTDFDVDTFFARRGVTNVDELLALFNPPNVSRRLALSVETDGTLPSEIVNHRIVAAVRIVEDAISRLGSVVEDVQLSRQMLGATVDPAQPEAGMKSRGLPFLVFFDSAQLDDGDLPVPSGSTAATPEELRADRLLELTNRMSSMGIAFAPLP